MSNPYTVLGLDASANLEEVRRAYRELALRYHPDKNAENQGKAHEEMVKLNAAYEQLTTRLSEVPPTTKPRPRSRTEAQPQSRSRPRPRPRPRPQPQSRQANIPKPRKMDRKLTDNSPNFFKLNRCMKVLVQFFQTRADFFQPRPIYIDLLALERQVAKTRLEVVSVGTEIRQISGGFDEWLPSRSFLATRLYNRVEAVASYCRLLKGVVDSLDEWVEAFKKGEKTDQEQFARLLAYFLRTLRLQPPWID